MLGIPALVLAVLPGAMLADAEPARAPAPGRHLLLVPDSATATLARTDARVIARYESFALVEAEGADETLLRDAGADRRDDMRSVGTAAGEIDPATRPSLAGKRSPDRDEVLALVQFVGPPKDAWLERLRATGAAIVNYQAENAYVVHASGAVVDRLAGLVGTDSAVRAVTPLTVADKLEDEAAELARYAVSTVAGSVGEETRSDAAASGTVVGPPATVGSVRTQYLRLAPDEVAELARDPAVVSIERDALPKPLDERAAQIVAGNLAAGLTAPSGPGYLNWHDFVFPGGTSVTLDVTDTGLDDGSLTPDHPDFAGRIAYQSEYTASDSDARDCAGHGTNVASIAAGFNNSSGAAAEDGTGFNYGLGTAPRVELGASKIFGCDGNAYSFSTSTLTGNAYAAGARVSNNSWGTGTQFGWGSYTTKAAQYDQAVRDTTAGGAHQPMVEIFSAGNDGDVGGSTINAEGTAKNVITVGASESVRATGTDGCAVTDGDADNAREIVGFSSRGPTEDGRLKPDLVAPGTHVTGARPPAGVFNSGLQGTCTPFFAGTYSLVSGTSQAAPAVTAAAALFRQWYQDTEGATPSPALTKAHLINSATDLRAGPDVDQGWGRVNLGSAFDSSTAREYYDQQGADLLTAAGETVVRSFTVPDPSKPLKVTLAWTDPPGSTSGGNAFVNNLDLEVAAGGRTYRGNVFDGSWSRPGGSADPRNNVESVYLPAGTSGRFSVTVRATTLGGDGLPGAGDTTDQDFALVVSNASEQAAPVLVHEATTIHDSDGDGVLESDEQTELTETVRNAGNVNATGVSASLAGGPGLSITQGGSAYPTVLADDGTAASSPRFGAHMANAATCGADLSATLSITSSGGSQTVPLTIPTGEPGPLLNSASPQVPLAIPDNNAIGVFSSVSVTERGRIKDLNVAIPLIAHSWVGDLVIDITGPDGTTVRLADHPGGPDNSSDNLAGTIFDDEAATSISAGLAPYSGNFRPQNDQLSRFDGKDRRGTWTLRVRDTFTGDTGTLAAWSVLSQKAVCDVDTTPPDTSIGGGPGASTTSTSAQFSLGSNDPGATYECRLDFAAYGPCDASVALNGLSLGAHTLSARAIDGSDNEDPSPATYSWAVVSGSGGSTGAAASFVLAPAEERLSEALAGRYRVLAACASACRTTAKLTVSASAARKLKLGRRSYALGSASKTRRSAGTVAASVRLSKKARGALRGRRETKATLTVTLQQGSSRLTVKRTVTLLRSGGLRRVASRGLRMWAACSRSCSLRGELNVSAAEARRIGLKPGRARRLEVATGQLTGARTPRVLTVKVKTSARRALQRAKRLSARLEAAAGRSPNPVRTATLSKTLRR